MKDHYELLKKSFYDFLPHYLSTYETLFDPETLSTYLFTTSSDKGLTDGTHFASTFGMFLTAYYIENSPYYRDDTLLEKARNSLLTYESYLHEDGSIDLLSTNFHDPAQTAFITQSAFSVAELLYQFTAHTPLEDALWEDILRILRKMGHAMATLGFHTPNHRWAICSGLAIAYRYTKEQTFLDAIEGFLKEGIDCDEYGEYTERSTGSYNHVCNRSFLIMGFYLDRPEFFEYPKRNLKLMYHFTEPNDTMNTLNSTRWDNGGEFRFTSYYNHYLPLALLTGDAEFVYFADKLVENGIPDDTYKPLLLTILMTHPELRERMKALEPAAPTRERTIFLPNSKIARVYKPEKNLTMTALASRSPVFFQMNLGSSILQARFAGSFFGDPHSPFRARTIQKTADGYRLICDENAGYRSQLAEKPETSNWRKMDHSKRQIINVQNFHTEITVHILEDGATFEIETDGCENIPTKLEISMQAGGKLFTDSLVMQPREGDYVYLRDGKADYFVDRFRYFEIEGASCKHLNGAGMRGTSPVNPKKFTVAITDVTPQHSFVTIRAKDLLQH